MIDLAYRNPALEGTLAMSIWSSLKRYIVTLGGLIGGDIDEQTDKMLSTPAGIKATFSKTRENWTHQFAEVREAVAQLMMVLEQKKTLLDRLAAEKTQNEIKMKGAVRQFKATSEPRYQQAFTELFNRQQQIEVEQQQVNGQIKELQGKVSQYREKLADMKKRIDDLQKQEAGAIADIVSAQQIINLNDRLNNLSTQLDDRNLQAIENRRESLKAQAKLSENLTSDTSTADMEKELMQAGMQSEAAEVFAAMLAADAPAKEAVEDETRQREL